MISTTARILLHDTHVASVAWDTENELGIFEYDPDFVPSGIQIAPLTMPLRSGAFSFPDLSRDSFRGLPGLLADSLPDKFGNLLIDRWLADQGRTPHSFNPVERLCYLGTRGMGGLEFEPTLTDDVPDSPIEVARLVELANRVLASRDQLQVDLSADEKSALSEILRVGTSAGGARAKAIVAWNPASGEVRSGQIPLVGDFEPWLIKFDGVDGNRDKELADPLGYGRIEYAYHRMAIAAGITMNPCRLLEENGRAHFMTKRFDRIIDDATRRWDKVHMQTLCGIAHMDFNQAGAYSYEQAFRVARELNLPLIDQQELYRRAIFNIVARNQDDHTKNIAFLMDRFGVWCLAPAYDVTYSYNPSGVWTGRHQMSFSGKRDDFSRDDLVTAAGAANLKPPQARQIMDQVIEAVRDWETFAGEAGVAEKTASQIAKTHRMDLAG